MVKYLYNELLWKWELTNVGVFLWLVIALGILITRRYSRPEFCKILAFAGFSYLMEHLSTDVDIKNLLTENTNVSWYHLGTPILFFLLTRFYGVYLSGKKNYHLDITLPVAFTMIAIINALYINELGIRGFELFPTVTIGLYSASGIILAVGYFIHLLGALPVVKLELTPLFWISAGMVIYYSANFLLWAGVTFINGNRAFFNSIYQINAWMTILLNAFFIISILTAQPMKPELTPASLNET